MTAEEKEKHASEMKSATAVEAGSVEAQSETRGQVPFQHGSGAGDPAPSAGMGVIPSRARSAPAKSREGALAQRMEEQLKANYESMKTAIMADITVTLKTAITKEITMTLQTSFAQDIANMQSTIHTVEKSVVDIQAKLAANEQELRGKQKDMEDGQERQNQRVTAMALKLDKLKTSARLRVAAIERQFAEIMHDEGGTQEYDLNSPLGSESGENNDECGTCGPKNYGGASKSNKGDKEAPGKDNKGDKAGPGSNGDGDKTTPGKGHDGEECHCKHVENLMFEMNVMKNRINRNERNIPQQQGEPHFPSDPWWQPPTMGDERTPQPPANGNGHVQGVKQWTLRLNNGKLGPLGMLAFDKPPFDDRITSQECYQHDGKSGDSWKGKVERYVISKVPALKVILQWAETCDMGSLGYIDENMLRGAIGDGMTETQLEILNSSLWGFLSNCTTKDAETVFKGAETLAGVDAWRRRVRQIDHGRGIRLETLRTEVREMHNRQIRDLEGVETGIALFENKLREYEDAGGRASDDMERKADLMAILPEDAREKILWMAADSEVSYSKFRETILNQTRKLVMYRQQGKSRKLAIMREEEPEERGDDESIDGWSREDLIAALRKDSGYSGYRPKGTDRRPGGKGFGRGAGPTSDRPIKCANCHGEHRTQECTKPKVEIGDRKCFGCGEKGHAARNCPKKGNGGGNSDGRAPIKAVNDGDDPFFGAVTDGYTRIRGEQIRPMPEVVRNVKFGDFINTNRFGTLQSEECTKMSQRARKAEVANQMKMRGECRIRDGYGCKRDASSKISKEIDELEALALEVMNAKESDIQIQLIQEDEDEEVNAVQDKVRIKVAMDSGAVRHTINPRELPPGSTIAPNTTGKHFVGADGSFIEKFGSCKTVMESECGRASCEWQAADVTKALHSVSTTTGPADGEGRYDVLFNNKVGVIVPPGIVDKILATVKPLARYKREGGLYVADMSLSGFTRQGEKK